ncbi:pyruvate dehydrogenase (acetyl-transferring) kinase, mitochondrial-like isoform X2 [Babylonia areolata]
MNWYEMSFRELIEFEKMTELSDGVLTKFTDVLTHIRNRHANVVETMAQGMLELKDRYGIQTGSEDRVQYFLDRFYMSRISIRMLINQHTLLFGTQTTNHPRHIGCIDPHCSVQDVIEDAYENAKFLCEQYYLTAPDLHIKCANPEEQAHPDIQIVYVPSHLYHMLFELFKNSMRATVENFPQQQSDLPPISVMICKGQEDLCIKLSDKGGGIARSKQDLLFQYMYSTAPEPSRSDNLSAPLAGYGYGLPLSRLYARYFQGDLVLSTMEGYGMDAYIYLKVLSDEANELLPVYNRTASKMYNTDRPVNDWSSKQTWSPGNIPQRSLSSLAFCRQIAPTPTPTPSPTPLAVPAVRGAEDRESCVD